MVDQGYTRENLKYERVHTLILPVISKTKHTQIEKRQVTRSRKVGYFPNQVTWEVHEEKGSPLLLEIPNHV